MQKYHRPTTKKGQAWSKKFNAANPVGGAEWFRYGADEGKLNGKRPKPASGVSAESFADSGKGFKIDSTEPYKKLNIRLEDINQKLFLYYRVKECYFVHKLLMVGVKYISKVYPNRGEALEAYKTTGILWRKRLALDESEEP